MAAAPALRHTSILLLTGNSLVRLISVGLRAVLTLAMAIWLQPSELGLYAVVAATLTLTVYFYGLDFQAYTMRELSTSDLAGARHHIRDQFALLAFVYVIGSGILALILTGLKVAPAFVALIVPMAVLQHAGLEFYRVLNRLGRPVSGTVVLLIRDAAWVPLCLGIKLLTGQLLLEQVLIFWLLGSIASAAYGAWLLMQWLPASARRPVDLAWLASGLRTGLRMLIGTLSGVALFTVDRMIFATLATPDELGAYAFFALGCTSLQGLFESAILPSFWAPMLQAKTDRDDRAYRRAERKLSRICLIAAAGLIASSVGILTVLTYVLPHPAYAANRHLLYFIAAAYALLTLTNIPHYRLYAAKLDRSIVTAKVSAFLLFLVLTGIFAIFARPIAVPFALAISCAWLLVLELSMARKITRPLASA